MQQHFLKFQDENSDCRKFSYPISIYIYIHMLVVCLYLFEVCGGLLTVKYMIVTLGTCDEQTLLNQDPKH